MSKAKDFTSLLIKRIKNFHISEGVSLKELEVVNIIVSEYFKVLFDFLINGNSIKVGSQSSPLFIDILFKGIEEVDLKKEKPLYIEERIDSVILIKCYGLYLIRKYNNLDLTRSAKKILLNNINYKNIKHI